MSKINKILIGVAVILAIAVVVVGIFFFRTRDGGPGVSPIDIPDDARELLEESQSLPESERNLGTGQIIDTPRQNIQPAIPDKTPLALELERKADNFAEIFGTFSTHSNFSNLVTLKKLSSEGMKKKLDTIIEQNAVDSLSNVVFKGTQTKSLSSNLVLLDTTSQRAIVEVQTQRRELGGDAERDYLQEIRVELIEVDGEWLLDGAFWGEIK